MSEIGRISENIAQNRSETTEEIIPSMDDMKEELEASFRRIRTGDIVTCVVVAVDEVEGATVDLNYYAPGRIATDEFSDDPQFAIMEEIAPGDEIRACVLRLDDGFGHMLLSAKQANYELAWKELKQLEKDKTPICVVGKEAVNGGVICYYKGIRAFIPSSKLALRYVEDTKQYVGRTLQATILTVDEEKKRLVLSCKDLLFEKEQRKKEEMLERIAVGSILNGTVEKLMNYGAFVNIGDGVSGLLHISEICEKRLQHPKERLHVGQSVKVKIIQVDKGKVSLSMKEFDSVLDKDLDTEEATEYVDAGFTSFGMASIFKNIKL